MGAEAGEPLACVGAFYSRSQAYAMLGAKPESFRDSLVSAKVASGLNAQDGDLDQELSKVFLVCQCLDRMATLCGEMAWHVEGVDWSMKLAEYAERTRKQVQEKYAKHSSAIPAGEQLRTVAAQAYYTQAQHYMMLKHADKAKDSLRASHTVRVADMRPLRGEGIPESELNDEEKMLFSQIGSLQKMMANQSTLKRWLGMGMKPASLTKKNPLAQQLTSNADAVAQNILDASLAVEEGKRAAEHASAKA
eukprot:NODE_3256_length_920_cov_86.431274_g3235_i0.p1 GENE.NODE_3256_length_920_cov_86.431274_g3235_i0~~NODE_3256_length_920_cov_86.431274_g3235_i0.p1  ORF type:complete len:285 (+),score=63.83 NODE_3256_length_920_cov_86.431274_g3235_i0:110-856(+)